MHTRFQTIALTLLMMFLADGAILSADAGNAVEDASLVSFWPGDKPKGDECETKPKTRSKPMRKTCKPEDCAPGVSTNADVATELLLMGNYLAEPTREPNMLITTDFLWWATNFGLPVSAIITGNNEQTLTYGRVLRPDTTFSPGVRLGLSGNLHYDHWDIQGFWTYYYNTQHENYPAGIGQLSSNNVSSHPQLRLTYNTADLELGATHSISRRISFRPFAGVRAAWLYQLHHQRLDKIGDKQLNLPIKLVEDIWAVGPRLGLNMSWDCKGGVHILANMSGSLLWGSGRGRLNATLPKDFNVSDVTIGGTVHLKDHAVEMIAGFQTFLGLDWERKFNCDRNSFKIAAGWESNYWAASSLILIFNPSVSFQGLTVDMVWGF